MKKLPKICAVMTAIVILMSAFTATAETAKQKYSINYGPYTAPLSPGAELDEKQVRQQLAELAKNFDSIRLFSCNDDVKIIYEIARELDISVVGTAWIDGETTETQVYSQLDKLAKLCNDGYVSIASVGSEVLERGQRTPEKMLEYIVYLKGKLTVQVPVTYMDTQRFFMSKDNVALNALNAECDVILFSHYPIFGVNYGKGGVCERYFGGDVIAYGLAELREVYEKVQANNPEKLCIIAETGWATNGNPNGIAYPNDENSVKYWTAVQNWATSENVEVYWFSVFDEAWKSPSGGIEAHWGIYYGDSTMKECFVPILGENAVTIDDIQQMKQKLLGITQSESEVTAFDLARLKRRVLS